MKQPVTKFRQINFCNLCAANCFNSDPAAMAHNALALSPTEILISLPSLQPPNRVNLDPMAYTKQTVCVFSIYRVTLCYKCGRFLLYMRFLFLVIYEVVAPCYS